MAYYESGYLQQFNDKGQFRIRRDHAWDAADPISQIAGDHKLTGASDFHAGDSFIPPGDYLLGAEPKRERPIAVVAGVELGAVGERSCVVDFYPLAGDTLCTCPNYGVLVLQSSRRLNHGISRGREGDTSRLQG